MVRPDNTPVTGIRVRLHTNSGSAFDETDSTGYFLPTVFAWQPTPDTVLSHVVVTGIPRGPLDSVPVTLVFVAAGKIPPLAEATIVLDTAARR